MSINLDPFESEVASRPWYLLWVLGALALAGTYIMDVFVTGRLSSVFRALAWLLFAFSWYAKPFRVDFQAKASKALTLAPLRSWVPVRLWNCVTFSAFALLFTGLVLDFTNAA
jgi:hypothetical protein